MIGSVCDGAWSCIRYALINRPRNRCNSMRLNLIATYMQTYN
jgi:hypothetical protein